MLIEERIAILEQQMADAQKAANEASRLVLRTRLQMVWLRRQVRGARFVQVAERLHKSARKRRGTTKKA